MKTVPKHRFIYLLLIIFMHCSTVGAQTKDSFIELEGRIIDEETNKPLVFVDVVLNNSNISTITNSDGEFLLKVPKPFINENITITHLGYKAKEIKISSIANDQRIALTPAPTTLNEINIIASSKNARELVEETLRKKSTIYNNRLDTLALKLQGGPFSNLYTDIIKYPEFIFTEENMPLYEFSYGNSTTINNKLIFVVNFKQKKQIKQPLYYGQLFIDANTLALTSAVYSLNVSNKELSSRMFVRKKPRKVQVHPKEANYRVNYRIKDGKWYYAYSNISLTFKVNWKGKLFNNVYSLNSEMAITDWEIKDTKLAKVRHQLIRPTTILTEKASGFSDPRFWGAYNIIEPEKSIESAIKKIQRQLKKT